MRIVNQEILLACGALAIAAFLPTLDWLSCWLHGGGRACHAQMASAITEWRGIATFLAGLAITPPPPRNPR